MKKKYKKINLNKEKNIVNSLTEKKIISFTKLSTFQWGLVFLIFLLGLFLLWQSFLPFLAEWYYRGGYNDSMAKNYPSAISQLEKAVAFAPWETYYQTYLGRMYEDYAGIETDLKQKKELIQLAQKNHQATIFIDPKNPWYHNRLAATYLLYANTDQTNTSLYLKLAEQESIKARDLDQNNPIFHLALGYFYHRYKRYHEAESCYQSALKIDPNLLEANFYLAEIYLLKHNPLAYQYYEQSYLSYLNHRKKNELDFEKSIYPFMYRVTLILAENNIQMHNYQKAIEILQNFIKQNQDQATDQKIMLGKIYYLQKNWVHLADLYQKLIYEVPDKKEVWQLLIFALQKTNQSALAKEKIMQYQENFR